jgi:hypothetical protein
LYSDVKGFLLCLVLCVSFFFAAALFFTAAFLCWNLFLAAALFYGSLAATTFLCGRYYTVAAFFCGFLKLAAVLLGAFLLPDYITYSCSCGKNTDGGSDAEILLVTVKYFHIVSPHF